MAIWPPSAAKVIAASSRAAVPCLSSSSATRPRRKQGSSIPEPGIAIPPPLLPPSCNDTSRRRVTRRRQLFRAAAHRAPRCVRRRRPGLSWARPTRVRPMTDRRNIEPQEWELRCDLAAAYRLFARFGMDDLIFTHLSVRLPGKDHRFLLNPFGYLFDEITASSLIAVDPEGHAIEPLEDAKINNAGFTIHSAVHMARDDAQCVMHSHTTAGMAVAAQEQGLLPLNQMSMQFFGRTSYHTYEGIA